MPTFQIEARDVRIGDNFGGHKVVAILRNKRREAVPDYLDRQRADYDDDKPFLPKRVHVAKMMHEEKKSERKGELVSITLVFSFTPKLDATVFPDAMVEVYRPALKKAA